MKKLSRIIILLSLIISPAVLFAASNDTTTINYEVQAINELNIVDTDLSITIDTAVAGAQPNYESTITTYEITTNCASNAKKITGQLNTDLPSGLTLNMYMHAPVNGSSPTHRSMSATPSNMVVNIGPNAEQGIDMDFDLIATVAAGVVSSSSKTLTVTLVDQ